MLTPILIGLSHSVETDHVLAVSNLVNVRHGFIQEALRGAMWGLGHTVSVMCSAFIIIFIRHTIPFTSPVSFELLVGVMMIVIGVMRIMNLSKKEHVHPHEKKKFLFFNVGIVHGLAGSGTIAALISGQMNTLYEQTEFLLLFGAGTILGMGIITAVFTRLKYLNQQYMMVFSYAIAAMSLLYGFKILYEQTLPYIN